MNWLRGGEANVEDDATRDSGLDRTWLLETEWDPGKRSKVKRDSKDTGGRPSSIRLELRQWLAVIALIGLLFAVIRSLLVLDGLGLLIWPVLLGFGIDRFCGGYGVWGGTGASALGFAGIAIALTGGPLGLLPLMVVGAIWGFYLSVWTYMIAETIVYYCY
jgi:hypothetical protein